MQRDIIKELLGEKMIRDQRTNDLNTQLATRIRPIDAESNGVAPIKDPVLLEQLSNLHNNIEATKESLTLTQSILSNEMSGYFVN